MDAFDRSKDRKPRSVAELYAELRDALSRLPKDRQKAAKGMLQMGSLALDLRQAIIDSSLTHYSIGKATGISPGVIDRFVSGERDLRLDTASKIAEVLGYSLKRTVPPETNAAVKKTKRRK